MSNFDDRRKAQPQDAAGSIPDPAKPLVDPIVASEASLHNQQLLQSLHSAYQAIDDFNSRNSAGKELGHVMSGLIFGQIDEHLPAVKPEDKLVLES